MLRLGDLANPPWGIVDLHTDHLGTVRAITDVYGQLASTHNYFPFGDEIGNTLSYNTHQYTGHERDRETGLDYMKARYYGDGLPRFLSPDPIGGTPDMPQSWNRYSYAQNSPILRWDPDGRADVALSSNQQIYAVWHDAVEFVTTYGLGPIAPSGRTRLWTAENDGSNFCGRDAMACAEPGKQVRLQIDNATMSSLLKGASRGDRLSLITFSNYLTHEGWHYLGFVGTDIPNVKAYARDRIHGLELQIRFNKEVLSRFPGLTKEEIEALLAQNAAWERNKRAHEKLLSLARGQESAIESFWAWMPGSQGDEVPRGEGSFNHIGIYINGVPQ
jgi:RHS repeat-associated protein